MSKVEKNVKPKVEQKVAKEEEVTLVFKNDCQCQGCQLKLIKVWNENKFEGFDIVKCDELGKDKPTLKLVVKGVREDVSKGIESFQGKHASFKDKISIVKPEKAAGSSDKKKTENGSEEKKPAEEKGAKNGEEKTTKKEAVEGKKEGGDKKPSQSQPKLREPFNRREYGVPNPPDMIGNMAALESSSVSTLAPTTYPDGQTILKQILPMLPDACSLM